MNSDVADYIKEEFPRMGAQIISGLSAKFKEIAEQDSRVAINIMRGDFDIVPHRSRDKK
jgi:hypothetical protein